MEEELKPFVRRGTGNKPIKVGADEVLNAIAEGQDVHVRYTVIDRGLDIESIAAGLDRDEKDKPIIQGNILIQFSKIRGWANFNSATFKGEVDFSNTIFGRDADFSRATFSGNTRFGYTAFNGNVYFLNTIFIKDIYFLNTTFNRNADFCNTNFSMRVTFRTATFGEAVNFLQTTMKHPANFAGVDYRPNSTLAGVWNYILRPLFWCIFSPILLPIELLTKGKVKLPKKTVTDFSNFNTTTIMDSSSNPYFKRYIDDEQWIESWRSSKWWRKALFYLWEATSHCGRSIGLWAFWSAAIAVAFAFIYRGFGCDSIAFNINKLNGVQPDLLSYLYYSVVTFTTLGFGDIVPLTNPARLVDEKEVKLYHQE